MLLPFVGCSLLLPMTHVEAVAEPRAPSLLQLLASPAQFEGRRVLVRGFCHFGFEEHAVYLYREDSDRMNSDNGLWLETDEERSDLNETFVNVAGFFTARNHGHLGAWRGAIEHITRLERAPSRAEIERSIQPIPRPSGTP